MPAGLSSLVLQIQAVFTALFAAVAPRANAPAGSGWRAWRSRSPGIGVAAVDEGASGPLLGFALVVAAAACWGVSNVLTRKAAPPDAAQLHGLGQHGPGPAAARASPCCWRARTADLAALRALDWPGRASSSTSPGSSTVFGFGAWGFLLRRHPASAVAPFSLLVPVFGMSSAALFLGEAVSPLRWCAAALLVGGVALTSLGGAGPGSQDSLGARLRRPTASQPPAVGPTASAPPAAADAPAPR